MKKNEYKETKIDKILKIALVIEWAIIFIFSFCLWCSNTVHASSEEDYFPMEQNKNGYFSDEVLSASQTYFDSENNYIFIYYNDYNYYIVYWDKELNGSIYGELNNNLIMFSLYVGGGLNIQNVHVKKYQYMYGQIMNLQDLGNNLGYIQNSYSSTYLSSIDYVSNFQLYTTSQKERIVLLYTDGIPETPEGDIIPPDTPKPNINDYINADWSNPPTFDSTDTSSALNSIYNIIKWTIINFKQDVNGGFNYVVASFDWTMQQIQNTIKNKINEIKTTIEEITTTITNAIGQIKTTIESKIAEIKTTIENVGTTITTIKDFLTNPFSSSQLQTQITNSSFCSQLTTTKTQFTTFFNGFSNITQAEHVKFDIDLRNIYVFNMGIVSLDFALLEPVLPYLRGLLTIIIVFALIVEIYTSINAYIGGNSSKNNEN